MINRVYVGEKIQMTHPTDDKVNKLLNCATTDDEYQIKNLYRDIELLGFNMGLTIRKLQISGGLSSIETNKKHIEQMKA